MAKVYDIDEYRIRKELRCVQENLDSRMKYCSMYGYVWVDHYSIRQMHEKISELVEQLKERTKNEKSS